MKEHKSTQEAAEESITLRALTSAKSGKGKPVGEVLEEIRKILNLPADSQRNASRRKRQPRLVR